MSGRNFVDAIGSHGQTSQADHILYEQGTYWHRKLVRFAYFQPNTVSSVVGTDGSRWLRLRRLVTIQNQNYGMMSLRSLNMLGSAIFVLPTSVKFVLASHTERNAASGSRTARSQQTNSSCQTSASIAFTSSFHRFEEQRAIASILGALDDKIELNRRMNATLESLARAIFKSWFVDFDPVHVKIGLALTGQMPANSAGSGHARPKDSRPFPLHLPRLRTRTNTRRLGSG